MGETDEMKQQWQYSVIQEEKEQHKNDQKKLVIEYKYSSCLIIPHSNSSRSALAMQNKRKRRQKNPSEITEKPCYPTAQTHTKGPKNEAAGII